MKIDKNISLLAIVWILLTGCVSTHAPQSSSRNVLGTVWIGSDSMGAYNEFHFLPRGILHYRTPTGFWKNATWKQNGSSIYMETNHKYAEYRGSIHGNTMSGKAWNIKGLHWTWRAKKTAKKAGRR